MPTKTTIVGVMSLIRQEWDCLNAIIQECADVPTMEHIIDSYAVGDLWVGNSWLVPKVLAKRCLNGLVRWIYFCDKCC